MNSFEKGVKVTIKKTVFFIVGIKLIEFSYLASKSIGIRIKYVNFNFKILYPFFIDVQSRASKKCVKQIECSIIIRSSSLSTF